MPKTSVISIFANLRHWLDTLHGQHGSRVLLKRQQVFMRMQRQQSQWRAHSLRGSEAPGATEEWRML